MIDVGTDVAKGTPETCHEYRKFMIDGRKLPRQEGKTRCEQHEPFFFFALLGFGGFLRVLLCICQHTMEFIRWHSFFGVCLFRWFFFGLGVRFFFLLIYCLGTHDIDFPTSRQHMISSLVFFGEFFFSSFFLYHVPLVFLTASQRNCHALYRGWSRYYNLHHTGLLQDSSLLQSLETLFNPDFRWCIST